MWEERAKFFVCSCVMVRVAMGLIGWMTLCIVLILIAASFLVEKQIQLEVLRIYTNPWEAENQYEFNPLPSIP